MKHRKENTMHHHHDHHHHHEHAHAHAHPVGLGDPKDRTPVGRILTIRAHAGLSGDMFLAGLLRMGEWDETATDRLLSAILPDLSGTVHLTRRKVNDIGGWFAHIALPHQHEHRSLADITGLIAASGMGERAKLLATKTFTLLAEAEARVHEKNPGDIHFHEVGALDSVLDICMTCELFTRLAPSRLVVSPLPFADGCVSCDHGILPVPAPAVLELLSNIPVCPFPGTGETVTPTAVALLRVLGAVFGPWPAMQMEGHALVYGKRVFANAPNGTLFAWGQGYEL